MLFVLSPVGKVADAEIRTGFVRALVSRRSNSASAFAPTAPRNVTPPWHAIEAATAMNANDLETIDIRMSFASSPFRLIHYF